MSKKTNYEEIIYIRNSLMYLARKYDADEISIESAKAQIRTAMGKLKELLARFEDTPEIEPHIHDWKYDYDNHNYFCDCGASVPRFLRN